MEELLGLQPAEGLQRYPIRWVGGCAGGGDEEGLGKAGNEAGGPGRSKAGKSLGLWTKDLGNDLEEVSRVTEVWTKRGTQGIRAGTLWQHYLCMAWQVGPSWRLL